MLIKAPCLSYNFHGDHEAHELPVGPSRVTTLGPQVIALSTCLSKSRAASSLLLPLKLKTWFPIFHNPALTLTRLAGCTGASVSSSSVHPTPRRPCPGEGLCWEEVGPPDVSTGTFWASGNMPSWGDGALAAAGGVTAKCLPQASRVSGRTVL